jgi:hypothetical protein
MVIIRTPTVNEYIKVVEFFLNRGYIWRSTSIDIQEKWWYKYKSETCIIIANDIIAYCRRTYSFSTINADIIYFYQYTRIYYMEKFNLL